MLDRLCRVIEWLCFIPLIITIYLLVALVTNVIIDANTPLQEMMVSKPAPYDDSYDAQIVNDLQEQLTFLKGINAEPEDIQEAEEQYEAARISWQQQYGGPQLRKPEDMYQLPADVSLGLLSFFSIIVYAFIYIVRGKVRFLPWR